MATIRMLSAALATVALVAAGCGGGSSSDTGSNGKNASRVLPVKANPIHNPSRAPGLRIDSVLVENNVDPATRMDAADHLEIHLRNTGKRPLRGLEVYYEITDLTTGDHEGYYGKLGALSIPTHAARTIHFDDSGAPGHYPDNPYSLYHSSKHALAFKVTVSAQGAAAQTANVKKDPGGEENPGE
jgi:hypothetical protein